MKTTSLPVAGPTVATGTFGYLWLNGERVIGIKGLSIYESCDKIAAIADISTAQKETLNRILEETLEQVTD